MSKVVKTERLRLFRFLGQDRTADDAEALRNETMSAELVPMYQLHPDQIYAWEKQVLDGAAAVFLGGTSKEASREADLSSSTPRAGFFLPEVRAMSRADGNAMIARGLGCGSNVLRIGRRPAPPDVEEVALTISGSFSPSLARASRIVNPRYP